MLWWAPGCSEAACRGVCLCPMHPPRRHPPCVAAPPRYHAGPLPPAKQKGVQRRGRGAPRGGGAGRSAAVCAAGGGARRAQNHAAGALWFMFGALAKVACRLGRLHRCAALFGLQAGKAQPRTGCQGQRSEAVGSGLPAAPCLLTSHALPPHPPFTLPPVAAPQPGELWMGEMVLTAHNQYWDLPPWELDDPAGGCPRPMFVELWRLSQCCQPSPCV